MATTGAPGGTRAEFETLIELPGALTCTAGHFGVHLFQGDLSVADMDKMDATGTTWQRRNPGKRVELVIVLPSNSRLSSEERTRMTRLMRRWEHERLASATVILAEGLRGAMHRSVLTGLMMLAPPPHPVKVFGTIEESLTFLQPYIRNLGDSAVASAPLQPVQRLYESFRARRAAGG
jgi:hypothetical protein